MKPAITRFAALAVTAILAGCATNTPEPPLSGTSWVGLTSSNEGMNFDFLPGGVLADGPVRGTWTQEGDTVRVQTTTCRYTGTVTGRTMTGSAVGPSGKPWTWRMNETP